MILYDLRRKRPEVKEPTGLNQHLPPAKALKASPPEAGPLQKAMWLWETEKILRNEAELTRLVEFCGTEGITDLFVQIPYRADRRPQTTNHSGWEIHWDPAPFRGLNRQLHAAGIRIHALDGDPRFSLREFHGSVLGLIREIIRYNRSVGPKERFFGIRFDNEPYLLPYFGGIRKGSVLRQYLELLDRARPLASQAGLAFGVDIPFWFDGNNEFLEPTAAVGGRPMSELIIDRVDNVGVMDYRTISDGADGVIAQGGDELAYASKRGKKVFIGLETVWLPNETLLEFQKQTGGKGAISIEDLGDGRARLTLNPRGNKGDHLLSQTRSVNVPSSKITFFAKTGRDLQDVMEEARREFSGFSSFLGFAIHSYESYRPWVERQR